MRVLKKMDKPPVLKDNETTWLSDYLAEKTNSAKRYRYRHQEIKQALKDETGYKCVYCESKIGHNTPGDVEHKIPSSKDPSKHFDWLNLTIACTECNRRKNDYYEEGQEFLDPYSDDVEELLEHHGPLVYWKAGNVRAEITVRKLELNSESRSQLIFHKMAKLESWANLVERWAREDNKTLNEVAPVGWTVSPIP
jgi:uncharacterized protein (TIGR02646 family)